MGEIIIRFPENVKKEFIIGSVKQIENLIEDFEAEKSRKVFEKLRKYEGIAKNKNVSQEDIHLQEDQ